MTKWTVVADRMRRRRHELGLTVKQAADRAGISEPQWDVMENARRESFRERSLRGVERALVWPAGGVDALLDGQDIYEDPAPDLEVDETSGGTPRRGSLDAVVDTLSAGHRTIVVRVLNDLATNRWVEDDDARFRVAMLNRLYTAPPADFLEDAVFDVIQKAHGNGVLTQFLEWVEFTASSLDDWGASETGAGDMPLAAQDDDALDHLEETPAEESPET